MSRYTEFPRNTKVAHIRRCAQLLKDEARIAAEVEAAHQEYAPTQIHRVDEMLEADYTRFCNTLFLDRAAHELGIDLTNAA